MIAVIYQIHLNEPAIFSTLEGDPNSASSHPYIPGSALRGMIIGLYIKLQRETDKSYQIDAWGEEQAMFFSQSTRYLNAYPMVKGKRSLPIPLTWTKPKYKLKGDSDQGGTPLIRDGAFPTSPSDNDPDVKTETLKGFVVLTDTEATVKRRKTVINVHNARARRDSAQQQVFRYEALPGDQTFVGVIVCDQLDHASELKTLLETYPQVTLGGSRTAGYGSATISEVEIDKDWSEVVGASGDQTILTFLSDALIRDFHGVYMPTPQAVQEELNARGIRCVVDPVSVKTVLVGGFNRKWGLPLPQALAIQAGSVLRLSDLQLDSDNALMDILEYGVGDRIEDGYGRVVVGWQHHGKLTFVESADERPSIEVPLSDESKRLLSIMSQRLNKSYIADHAAARLFDEPYTIKGNISRTQLANLRSVIANALRSQKPSLSAIDQYLTRIAGKSGGRQFDGARIDNQPLSQWLRKPSFKELDQTITCKERYALQLIDLVLERAYRERDKRAQRGGK